MELIQRPLKQQRTNVPRVWKSGKKKVVDEKNLDEFETMWRIKQQDLAAKEKLSKMNMLQSLLGKKEPLADYEESLKKKLINDLF